MKVAYINSVAGFGSTGRIVWQLASLPDVQGKIYYGRKENKTDAETYRITGRIGNGFHILGTFASGRHGFYNASETMKMIEDMKKFDPDIIHLHNLHGFYLDVKTLMNYLSTCGKPVIWTMHDCWAFTGHCAHYEGIGCDKWKTGCHDCRGLNKYPYTFNGLNVKRNYEEKKQLFNSFAEGQLTIAAPSDWLREQIGMSFLKEQKVITVHNGIDPEKFRYTDSSFRTDHHLENKRILLAVASVWYREKGLNDLVELSGKLDGDSVLVIVGVSKKQSRLFDEKHTVCIQRTEDIQELCGIYSTADYLLNPTYEDTFPTVNLEAQACGCPVITYRTGGSTETVTEETGAVTEEKNCASMLKTLASLPARKTEEMRNACRENAGKYGLQTMLCAYDELYKTVTGARQMG